MSRQWSDMADVLRSWIAQNWNAKTASIAAVATATGIALVYLWKSDNNAEHIAEVMTEVGKEYDRMMTDRKRQLFADLESLKDARGDGRLVLLEIGCGGGNNFKYYPAGSEVICADPNRHYEAMVQKSVRQHPEVRISAFHAAMAENMREVQSGSVDAVVSTVVFCSVTDTDKCIREIIRVLKPGGKWYFMEHVRAPLKFYVMRFTQTLLNVVWPFLYDRCHLTRTTQKNIRKAGFSSVDIEEFEAYEMTQPSRKFYSLRFVRSHISGTATK